jgi:AcrR family transcriptional regulator
MTKTKKRARREEDKDKRRDAILNAAEKVIAKVGVKGANFGAIAKASRLSRSLIYFYFPTNGDLIEAVCERGATDLRNRFLKEVSSHKKGLDQVMAMARAYLKFAREEPLYFSVIAGNEAGTLPTTPTNDSERELTDTGKEVIGLVAQSVERGQKDGSISRKCGDPLIVAVSIWGFTHGLIQVTTANKCMIEQELSLEPSTVVEHGFGMLRQGLAAGSRHL